MRSVGAGRVSVIGMATCVSVLWCLHSQMIQNISQPTEPSPSSIRLLEGDRNGEKSERVRERQRDTDRQRQTHKHIHARTRTPAHTHAHTHTHAQLDQRIWTVT